LVQDDYAYYLVDVIRAAAQNVRGVDGNIFIMAVHDAVRIRTGQRGPEAL
jgi:nitrogen regulatory protein P-II 1